MRRKIQLKNRVTDLSLEINHVQTPISLLTKTGFHASNRRSLLSESELRTREAGGRATGANVFCFLSSLPLLPQAITVVMAPKCHLSTLNWQCIPLRACLSIWLERFRGSQKEECGEGFWLIEWNTGHFCQILSPSTNVTHSWWGISVRSWSCCSHKLFLPENSQFHNALHNDFTGSTTFLGIRCFLSRPNHSACLVGKTCWKLNSQSGIQCEICTNIWDWEVRESAFILKNALNSQAVKYSYDSKTCLGF